MNKKNNPIDMSNLSSRKLWQLLSLEFDPLPSTQLQRIEQELRARQHYVDELNSLPRRTLH